MIVFGTDEEIISNQLVRDHYLGEKFEYTSICQNQITQPFIIPINKENNMQITVKGVNLDVTPPLEEHVCQKLDKVASHLSTITSVDVILKLIIITILLRAMSCSLIILFLRKQMILICIMLLMSLPKSHGNANKYKEKMTDHH